MITLRRRPRPTYPDAPPASVRALAVLTGNARRDLAWLMLLVALVLGISTRDALAVAPQALAALLVLTMGARAEGLSVGAVGRLGLILLCVAFALLGGEMTHVLKRFLCAIAAISLLKPRAPREHGFLLGVALLETALAWAFDDGWGLLVAGLAFAVLTHRALASWHRWRCALRVTEQGGTIHCPPDELRGFRAAADRAALVTIALAVPVFLVLPRSELPLLTLPNRGESGGGLGVGDEVRLRGLGSIGDPEEPVGTAEPRSAAAQGQAPYLRTAVFDKFDGRAWTHGGGEEMLYLDSVTHRTEPFGPPLDDEPVRFAIVVDASATSRLPLLEGTSSITFNDPVPARYALSRSTGTVRAMHIRPVARHLYVVEAPSGFRLPGDAPSVSTDDPLVRIPHVLENELRPAVGEVLRGVEGDGPRALALLAWVRGRARYDLGGAPSGPNPVGDFLFRTRRGHCEYFASALACCLRTAKIPARLVAGWHASRWNAFGGFWTLRRGDAHAWVEAYLDDAWVRLDATPQSVLEEDPYDGVFGFLSRVRDAIDFAWNRDVLAYDPSAQRKTLRSIGDAALGAWSKLRSLAGPWLALPVLLVLAWFVRTRRRARASAARGDPTASAIAFYAQFLRVLRRRGVVRGASEAPLAFSARAADHLDPAAMRAFAAATDAFLHARYGDGRWPPDAEIEGWLAALRSPRGVRKVGQVPGLALP